MLSPEQQQLVADSVWVVNAVLKKQGLQGDEDLRSQGLLYLCTLVQRFNPNKATWNTYAYKSVYLYLKRIHAQEKKNNSRIVPLDENITADTEYADDLDTLPFYKKLTPKEQKVVKLRLENYTVYEIACKLNLPHTEIKTILSQIKHTPRQ